MPTLDFDAALAAEEREPVVFTINGQTFQGIPVDDLPWTAGMKLADAPEEGAEAIEAIREWIDTVLLEPERDRFALVFQTLSFPAMKRLLEGLVPVYAGRPTGELSTSPTGSVHIGPTSKDDSSSPAEAKVLRLVSEVELEEQDRAATG